MTHYGPQLISHLQYYRQAIIETFKCGYPSKLYEFNKSILCRKLLSNQTTYVKKQGSSINYLEELKHLRLFTNRNFLFHDELIVKHIKYKTLSSIKLEKFSDCCNYLF